MFIIVAAAAPLVMTNTKDCCCHCCCYHWAYVCSAAAAAIAASAAAAALLLLPLCWGPLRTFPIAHCPLLVLLLPIAFCSASPAAVCCSAQRHDELFNIADAFDGVVITKTAIPLWQHRLCCRFRLPFHSVSTLQQFPLPRSSACSVGIPAA